ncbi:MAG: MerR family transcriptional regulator [Candidatus Omnitrophica bacterium]|nr:MerR family transcriptional regulator [Candidatus Omnitrophota bacterium]
MLHLKDGRVQAYPYGSEEQIRWELVLEHIFELDRLRLERLLREKTHQREEVEQILAVPDRRIAHRRQLRRLQRYNLTQAAKILQVTRQGLYYWMKKGWVKARRDHRSYQVFTVFDIEQIMKWRDVLK